MYRKLMYLTLAWVATTSIDAAEVADRTKEELTTRLLLKENAQAKEPYKIRYDGKNFVVHPGVFSPKYFPDTLWFADRVKVQPGDSFLEIGSGTGLISVMAAIRGAGSVTAVDVNPAAVQNTAENVFLNHVGHKFRILQGDVFDPIPRGEEFDVIFWFAPFMYTEQEMAKLTELEKAVFDPHYRSLKKFLSRARVYLRPNGKVLLGFSSTHGQMQMLEELAGENGWEIKVLEKEEENIPQFPGLEQADSITVLLIELKAKDVDQAFPSITDTESKHLPRARGRLRARSF